MLHQENLMKQLWKQLTPPNRPMFVIPIVLILAFILALTTLTILQMTKPPKIDFSIEQDVRAEKYYATQSKEVLNAQDKQLGRPFELFDAKKNDPYISCSFSSVPHATRHGCEISQTSSVDLESQSDRQKFYEAATKLDTILESEEWETSTEATQTEPRDLYPSLRLKPFASYVTTQPLPFLLNGSTTPWPTLNYYKSSYFQEIDHDASCSISMSVNDTEKPLTISLQLGCHFHFTKD